MVLFKMSFALLETKKFFVLVFTQISHMVESKSVVICVLRVMFDDKIIFFCENSKS